MDAGDHFKNGASPKSQMSRGNFLKIFLVFGLMCVFTIAMAQDTIQATVELKRDNLLLKIEISPISKNENNQPTLTIYSEAITGGFGGSMEATLPIVVCVLTEDGKVVDPMWIAGGRVGGSGYKVNQQKTVVKDKTASGGKWEATGSSGAKGFLTYSFDTDKPIKSILIGLYSDYANSKYSSFVVADKP